MTRLVLAWMLVALWFLLATAASAGLVSLVSRQEGQEPSWMVGVPLPLLKSRLVEAGLLTLLGSLWFDTMGSGAWWLVFLLVGALATVPAWTVSRSSLLGLSTDLVRYLVAGAILAWRLG